jgi:hypothetical protein
LAEPESAAVASWEHRVQQVLQRAPVETAVQASHAAALVREVFPAAAVAVADSPVVVAPEADQQEPWAVQVMIKELVAVAPEVLHLPVV